MATTVLLSVFSLLAVATHGDPQSFTVTKLRSLPHVNSPWTQGLELLDSGHLLETIGSYPAGVKSEIRVLDVATGRVEREIFDGLDGRFIEGIARTPTGWVASTYNDKKALKYDKNLTLVSELEYSLEGWGLASSPGGEKFFATDGSASIMELDADSLAVLSTHEARCMGKAVPGLNELEMVEDFHGLGPTLLGNVYRTRLVMGIDPKTFECNSIFHLEGLGPTQYDEKLGLHVANGIAWLPASKSLMVTGKNWAEMFEISLSAENASEDFEALTKLRSFLGSSSWFSLLQTKGQLPTLVEAKPHSQSA